jgi:Putative transposase
MALAADEFIRRFLLHTLSDGFHRIGHYGFLSNRHRTEKVVLCREFLTGGAAAPLDHADEPGQTRDRTLTSVRAAAGLWRCSGRFRDRAQPIPRYGRTAHECRGLVLIGNRLAILAASPGPAVTRPARPRCATFVAHGNEGSTSHSPMAFPASNGAPPRRSPVTAPLPAGLKATLTLLTPAFHSP